MAKVFQGKGMTVTESLRLGELSARFRAFRASSRPGTRIPQELREEVLAALRHGVAPSKVYSSCGLTGAQVSNWRSRSGAGESEAPVPAPRVLSVVEENKDGGDRDMQIDVRVGSWRFCVKRAVR